MLSRTTSTTFSSFNFLSKTNKIILPLYFNQNTNIIKKQNYTTCFIPFAGHNKWSKIKHQKAITDVQKMKIFSKISREIKAAVKMAGAGPENLKLRLCFEKARKNNMPKHLIESAIKSGLNEKSADMEYHTYEGYGPGGVAFLVEALTENKNRTAQQVRTIFSQTNGQLGTSVGWCFEKKGQISFTIPNTLHTKLDNLYNLFFEKLISLDEKIEDFKLEGTLSENEKEQLEGFIYCDMDYIHTLKNLFENEKSNLEKEFNVQINNISCEIIQLPLNFVEITNEEMANEVESLISKLDEHDDVQNVYHNASFNIFE